MPNIEDFSAGNIAIRPTETGVESVAATGRRLGAYGSQIAGAYQQAGHAVGQAVHQAVTTAEDYLGHRDINTAAKQAADFTVNHNQSWDDFITGRDIPQDDPNREDKIAQRINNPSAAKAWREQSLEPDLQTFQQGRLTPAGQQWASHFANTYREHMAVKTSADQSSMAGAVVQSNLEKTGDSLSLAVFNDPSSLKTNFDLLDHAINGTVGSSPTLSPELSAKVTEGLKQKMAERLVQSAIQGTIFKGGDYRRIANNPAYAPYIKPAENAQFERTEKTYQRGIDLQTKQAQVLQKQLQTYAVERAHNKIMADNVEQDVNGNVTINPRYFTDTLQILKDHPDAPNTATVVDTMLKWGESQQARKSFTSDPTTVGDLDSRMFDPNNPTTSLQVFQAEANHKIDADTRRTRLELINGRDEGPMKDPAVKAAIQAAKDRFLTTATGDDPFGSEVYARFMQNFLKDYSRASVSPGGPPPNALDMRDPNSLISKSMRTAREPLQKTLTPPAAPAPLNDTIAPPPDRPKNYPKNAQWDVNRKYWFLIQDGQKFRIDPSAQPTQPPPIPTPPLR